MKGELKKRKRHKQGNFWDTPANVIFSAQLLTLWLRNSWSIAHLAAKKRFSRRFVLMQNGVACGYEKMNIYLKQPPFAPVFGLFAVKWSAFWC